MKINKLLLILFLAFSFGLSSCDEDEDTPALVLPSNLSLTVVEDTASPGKITAIATASNTNYYTFIFTANNQSQSRESRSGVETYQFLSSGSHTVRVRAHITPDKYIEKMQVIAINLSGGGGGGTDSTGAPTSGYSTPMSYPNYTLVWNDEFNDSTLNTNSWNYEIGTGSNGWGNNELQYYLQENTSVEGGYLIIEAKDQFFNGSNYTSSRLTTENKRSFQYGRIDIRAAMPYGQGMWPALWMLGDNFSTAGWPFCGEIDIMEMVGGTTNDPTRGDQVTLGTVHWDDNGSYASFGGTKKNNSGTLAEEFHVYSIIWDSQKIEWYFDDVRYHVIDITPPALSEFHQKFFFIFNIAVGGNLPGPPNANTTFPQKMFVDYVRVFQ